MVLCCRNRSDRIYHDQPLLLIKDKVMVPRLVMMIMIYYDICDNHNHHNQSVYHHLISDFIEMNPYVVKIFTT